MPHPPLITDTGKSDVGPLELSFWKAVVLLVLGLWVISLVLFAEWAL